MYSFYLKVLSGVLINHIKDEVSLIHPLNLLSLPEKRPSLKISYTLQNLKILTPKFTLNFSDFFVTNYIYLQNLMKTRLNQGF